MLLTLPQFVDNFVYFVSPLDEILEYIIKPDVYCCPATTAVAKRLEIKRGPRQKFCSLSSDRESFKSTSLLDYAEQKGYEFNSSYMYVPVCMENKCEFSK